MWATQELLNQECQLLSSTTLLPRYDQSKPMAKFCYTYRHLLIRSFYNLACKILSKQLPVFQRQKSITSIASMEQPESQNTWQDPRQSKGLPEDHSKGADCNFSWICMSYSGQEWKVSKLFELMDLSWMYLFIYQGDPISNFHHVNQMPPIPPIKKKFWHELC